MHRRAYERYLVESSATLCVEGESPHRSMLRDISPRGAGIVTTYPLVSQQKLTLLTDSSFFFKVPTSRQTKVVWCEKIGDRYWRGGLAFDEDDKVAFAR